MNAWLQPGSRRRRLVLSLGVYVICTAAYFACSSRQVITEHTIANHYALLADGWLHGHLDLGHAPPSYTQNNDFAEYQGRWYISFGPFPAVLLVPWLLLAKSPENLRDGQVWLWYAGIAPAVLFLALEKLRFRGFASTSERGNLVLSLLFAFGTVYFFSVLQGTVWFAGHTVSVALSACFLLFAIEAESPVWAGAAMGLVYATRPPMVLASLFFLFEAVRVSGARYRSDDLLGSITLTVRSLDYRRLLLKLGRFALPLLAVFALTCWHNKARFGSWFVFGHEFLTVGWHARIEKWGLFSYHYLARNLGIALTSLPYLNQVPNRIQINTHGIALWLTTPLYLWLLWPRRIPPPFLPLLGSAGLVALSDLLYQNSGWLQFGYRFSNDYAVYLFALLAMGGYRMGKLFWGCSAFALAVNLFGALTFDRKGRDLLYYVDSTQKIIYQPD